MGKLFGTDGIRGKINTHPMNSEIALAVGRAVALSVKKENRKTCIIIGKDTRQSGDMIETAIISGICSAGVHVKRAGIIPTPGIAYLTVKQGADAGIVISASHNPYYDNGIKVFNEQGYKLSKTRESEIESLALNNNQLHYINDTRDTGIIHDGKDGDDQYMNHLKTIIDDRQPFHGINIVIDCSNGATYKIAPLLFSELGANITTLFNEPDGKNINEDCGSQHPEILSETVRNQKADIGLAFDGDGDRLIAVDEEGTILTGDQILAVCAYLLKQNNKLSNNTVVSTVMSNMGLKLALDKLDINHLTTDVGDRFVMEKMIASGSVLGGEDSGHTIFLDHHTTGDGMLTAIKVLESMIVSSKPLSRLSKIMNVLPQVLINVDVNEKPLLETVIGLKGEIESVENALSGEGRVLIRYSGTQPQCRVMVEGPSQQITEKYCMQLSEFIKQKLGS